MPGELLPIKVVFPSKEDYQRPAAGGSERRVFIEVTPSIRDQFVSEVGTVKRAFSQSFKRFPDVPAVARIKLRPEALAKTHRPSGLFNKNTCPVIGSASPGELLVSVTPQGLDGVADRIASGTSSEAVASISSLVAIQPYHAIEYFEEQIKSGNRVPMACRLFRHPSLAANAAIERALSEVVTEAGGKAPSFVWYTNELSVFSLGSVSDKIVKSVAAFVGTQSVCSVPDYKLVRSSSRPLEKLTADRFPAPDPNQHYGLVGLIDSGTDPKNKHIQAWVEARYEIVPPSRQKHDHGTFVAGLLIHGRRLNNNDGRFPAGSSKIVDVVAIDEDGQINETELILIIDTVLAKFPQVKVCHASACRSYLAVQMDTRVETDWAVWGATECRVPFRPKVLPVGQSVPSGTILRGNTPHPGSTVLSGLACGPKLTSVVRSFVHVHVTGLLNRSNSPYVAAPVHRRLKTSGCGNSVPTTAPMPWCVYSETVVATTFTRCVRKFVKHCHEERSHRSLGNELILRSRPSPGSQAPSGRVACQERLGGVLKSYHRSAA